MVRHDICRHSYAVERGLVVGFCVVTDPTIRQPGFRLPHHTWSLMNRFRTGQGPCRANLHKWGLAQSPSCDCGQRQTMNHIVDSCPSTKLGCRLNLLHEADDAQSYGWNYSECSACEIIIIILVVILASVRPILRIGEYSLVASQHRRIRYIGLPVSTDAE